MCWADSTCCKGCHKKSVQKNPDSITALDGRRKEMMCRTKAKSSKEEWKWQGGLTSYPKLSQNGTKSKPWNRRWVFGDVSGIGRKNARVAGRHIAIDVSLKGVSVRDAACAWVVVQPDYDKEEPWYLVYGITLAELEV